MDKKVRVAINGFGRIGRAFFKLAFSRPDIDIVAINDLGDLDNLAYLLKYDSVYGVFPIEISTNVVEDKRYLILAGKNVQVFNAKDPKTLPWGDLKIDVVVESTGVFDSYDGARQHITAGARKVVISAPAKGEPVEPTDKTILVGLNDQELGNCIVTSNASCTTNSVSPVIAILDEVIGVEKAILNTVHAYTATQSIVDSPCAKDFRRGRAAAQNIVPSSTGAAEAVTKSITKLQNKFDGIAMRVPTIVGSIADVTFISKRPTSVEEVNDVLKKAAASPRWRGIFRTTEDQIVSQDIVGDIHASIADLQFTRVVDGNLVKVLAWYDNEVGYTNALVEHVIRTAKAKNPNEVKKPSFEPFPSFGAARSFEEDDTDLSMIRKAPPSANVPPAPLAQQTQSQNPVMPPVAQRPAPLAFDRSFTPNDSSKTQMSQPASNTNTPRVFTPQRPMENEKNIPIATKPLGNGGVNQGSDIDLNI